MQEIADEVRLQSQGGLQGIMRVTDQEVVSTDFVTSPYSSVLDISAGIALNSTFVKLVSWYDNEWGYSNRLVDLACFMADADGVAQGWSKKPEVLKNIRDTFNAIDANGNGSISKDEFVDALKKMGQEDPENMFKEFDMNNDGTVSWFEFSKVMWVQTNGQK